MALKMFSWFETTFKFEVLQMPGSDSRSIISFPIRNTFEHDNARRFHAQRSCDIILYAIPLTTPYTTGTALRETRTELSLERGQLPQHAEVNDTYPAGHDDQFHLARAASNCPRILALFAR